MRNLFFSRIGIACILVGLSTGFAGCAECGSCRETVHEDRYERVKCTHCPCPKYVYTKAPAPPDKVVCVHRIKEPCPPRKIVHVTLPAPCQKVRYKYVNEGSCAKPCPRKCD